MSASAFAVRRLEQGADCGVQEFAASQIAGAFTPDTWAAFTGKLDEVFKDPNERRKAMEELLRRRIDMQPLGRNSTTVSALRIAMES